YFFACHTIDQILMPSHQFVVKHSGAAWVPPYDAEYYPNVLLLCSLPAQQHIGNIRWFRL
ncbi:MAG: hypothetical protein ACM3ZQ_08740, partial [Bacillota bacterium]